jgi:hypothetical protein
MYCYKIITIKYSRHLHSRLSSPNTYLFTFFFCKYIHIIHRNTQTQYKQPCSCTQMFALCGNRTRELLRSRRVLRPLRQIGRQENDDIFRLNIYYLNCIYSVWRCVVLFYAWFLDPRSNRPISPMLVRLQPVTYSLIL